MVDILVGPNKKPYRVHKDLLCAKIPYFNAMFNGGFQEATKQAATLPEDNPEVFDLLLEWVYTGRLSPVSSTNDAPVRDWRVLLELYLLAEKIVLPKLMDCTMSTIVASYEQSRNLPSNDRIERVYQESPPQSLLRKFMVRALHYVITISNYRGPKATKGFGHLLSTNETLATDLVELMRGTRGKVTPDPRKIPICTFHVHPENEECEFKARKD